MQGVVVFFEASDTVEHCNTRQFSCSSPSLPSSSCTMLAQAHRMLLSGFHTVASNMLRCSQSSNYVDKDNSTKPSQTLSRSLALAVTNTVQGCSGALGLTDCDILIRLQLLTSAPSMSSSFTQRCPPLGRNRRTDRLPCATNQTDGWLRSGSNEYAQAFWRFEHPWFHWAQFKRLGERTPPLKKMCR